MAFQEAEHIVSAAPNLTEQINVARGRRGFITSTTLMRRNARTFALIGAHLALQIGAGLCSGEL